MLLLFQLLARLPLPALHALGDVIGVLMWLIPNNRRRVALINIALCWPQLDAAAQQRMARAALRHEMKAFCELPFFWLGPKQKLLDSIRQATGEEVLNAAIARGKGVILLTMHLGGFEASGHKVATRHPITGIYKPQGGTYEQLGVAGRTRTGAKLIPAQGGSVRAQALPLLAANEAVFYMPDQDPPEGRGLFAPFFGVSAHSPVMVAKLAQESGAAVVFAYSERLPRGRGYLTHYHLADEAIYSPDLAQAVAAMNAGVERCIRECPEQYWWSYKRFRRRPPGEQNYY